MTDITFSIVTPCLNRVHTLGRMRQSVTGQRRHNVQHIIIDGGSTDGSVEWAIAQSDMETVVVPGEGLYAAINRGISLARNDVVMLLNTDDELVPGALDAWSEAFLADPALDVVAGSVEFVEQSTGKRRLLDDPKICGMRARNFLMGQAMPNAKAFKRSTLTRIGEFDTRWRLISDRDFMLRAALLGLKETTISKPVYRYFMHEGSLTISSNAVSSSILQEQYTMAAIRLFETRETHLEHAYKQLHACSAIRWSIELIRKKRISEAVLLVMHAFFANPLFVFRACPELLLHIVERKARRGRDCGPISSNV